MPDCWTAVKQRESVYRMEDKPLENEELEEALPRLKECELENVETGQ